MKKIFVLSLLFSSLQANSAEITLYAINSPSRLNWSSPKSLFLSTIKSYARLGRGIGSRHKIGHAYIGFKCDGQNEVLSGMTSGPGFSAKTNLFKKKVGLSVILMDNPGAFQTHEKVLKDINNFTETKRINALKVQITNEECLKLQDWYVEYSSSEKFIYGGVDKRPLTGEGAGCTAYAMSFFEYANIDFDFFNEKFLRTIYMPNELMGGELGENKEVPIKHLLKNKTNLSLESESALRVDLYDANDMFHWIQDQWNEYKKKGSAEELKDYEVTTSLQNKMKILKLTRKQ